MKINHLTPYLNIRFLAMNMLEEISFFLFLLTIGILVYLDRKNLEVQGPILIRRTKKGKRRLERWARKRKKLIRILGLIAGIVSIPLMLLSFGLLLKNVLDIFLKQIKLGAALVLPAPVAEVKLIPGMLLLPWYFWVIAALTVFLSHELAHALVALAERIPVRSIGLFLLLFIPGAFVEPDEQRLKRAKKFTKLKVYGVGSLANLIVAALALLLLQLTLFAFFEPIGISYAGIVNGSPAMQVNLSGIILSINGTKTLKLEDLNSILLNHKPGDVIEVETTKRNFTLRLGKHPANSSRAFLGISCPCKTAYKVRHNLISYEDVIEVFYSLLLWIMLINFNIALVNMLPLKPLDGGKVLETILGEKHWSKPIANGVSLLTFFLLLLAFFGPFIF